MSVREQIFVRVQRPAVEVAETIAVLAGGRVEERDGTAWLLVDAGRLVDGVPGVFGGPVLPYASEAGFRPDGEFEAVDAYNVEVRLWLAGASSAPPEAEERAAAALFRAIGPAGFAALRVRDDDVLVQAVRPDGGFWDFPAGTTVYDWDEPRWNGFVER